MQISLSNTCFFLVLPKGNTVVEFLCFGFQACVYGTIYWNTPQRHTHTNIHLMHNLFFHCELIRWKSLSISVHLQLCQTKHTPESGDTPDTKYILPIYFWRISINSCRRWRWRTHLFKQLTGMAPNSQNRSSALSRVITFTLKSRRIISEKHFMTS